MSIPDGECACVLTCDCVKDWGCVDLSVCMRECDCSLHVLHMTAHFKTVCEGCICGMDAWMRLSLYRKVM